MRGRIAGAAAGFAAALALVVGCGGDNMADVAGTVTVDGTPAEKGAITFFPLDGKSPTTGAEITPGGKYSARVPIGNAKVDIRIPKQVGTKKLYPTPDSPVAPIYEETLPKKYNDESDLTYDIKAGKNEKNWEVSTKK